MRKLSSIVLLSLLVTTCAIDSAWAWGPATHVGLAESVLSQLGVLPGAIAAILAQHGLNYVFGSIAADVVFAKRWSRVKQFCHHWSTGFKLLEGARDDREKAFAYGYLSHLAADTVAHGKYVPRQVVFSNSSVNFGHLYWELRADAAEEPEAWRRLEYVLDDPHHAHHETLADHIRDTFLPYELNRLLFAQMNALTMKPSFRRTVDFCGRVSRWPLSQQLLEGYRGESVDRIHDVLTRGLRSSLMREDPNGTSALMQVRVCQREIRRMKREGVPIEHRVREVAHGWSPRSKDECEVYT